MCSRHETHNPFLKDFGNKCISASFIFSDCKEVVGLYQSSKPPPWEVAFIVSDIRVLLASSGFCIVLVR